VVISIICFIFTWLLLSHSHHAAILFIKDAAEVGCSDGQINSIMRKAAEEDDTQKNVISVIYALVMIATFGNLAIKAILMYLQKKRKLKYMPLKKQREE